MKIGIFSANMGSTATNKICKQTLEFDFINLDNNSFPLRPNAMHPRLCGKIPKMMAWELYSDYDIYIWVDAPFSFNKETSLEWYISQLGDKQAAFFEHPQRKTVGEELEFMETLMKQGNEYLLSRYKGEPMRKQYEYYINQGFIDDNLFACTSFIYSKDLVKNREYNIMKEWFLHNCMWSVQDQLSLPYLLQKFKVDYNIIKGNSYEILLNL